MEHDSGHAGAVVTVVFGWLETKATSRSNQEFARGPDWLGFTDKIMAAHPVMLPTEGPPVPVQIREDLE